MQDQDVLDLVKELFDEHVWSQITTSVLGESSAIVGKDEFFKALKDRLTEKSEKEFILFDVKSVIENTNKNEPLYPETSGDMFENLITNLMKAGYKFYKIEIKNDASSNWICNECNAESLPGSIPETEIDAEMHSCINCGGFEFHKND